jgi:hypothetical protein
MGLWFLAFGTIVLPRDKIGTIPLPQDTVYYSQVLEKLQEYAVEPMSIELC